MAEALVSTTLEQITNIGEMKLIVGANELQKLNENLAGIRVLLEDAEKKQVVDRGVNEWLNKLQGICYDIDDVLDEWNTTTARKLQLKEVENASNLWRKVRSHVFSQSFGSKQVFLRQTSALFRIKEINKALDQIVKEQHDFNFRSTMGTQVEQEVSSPVIYLPKVVGKDYDKTAVVNYLLNGSSQVSTIPIVSIVGMIGIENTTLAQLVVNDDKVKDRFHNIIWVSVLKTFDEIMVAKAILTYLKKDVAPNIDNLKNLLGEIRQWVESKKFLLVLEDVWIEIPKTWELFKHALSGSQGSGILVTTSTIKSAKIMGTTKMILLGNEWQSSLLLSRQTQFPRSNSEDKKLDVEFWSLLCKVAFSTMTCDESEHLSPLFENMLGSCNGLPSAVMILGSLLSLKTKSQEWESVDRELSELEKIKNEFPTPLLLSYIELPSKLKKCFSYCAIFPEDFVINKDNLIRLWMAQGYLKVSGRADLELVGEEYFAILAMRHFFHDFERSVYDGSIMRCKMPHIVHDFAKFLMEKECLNLIDDGPSKSQLEVPYVEARHAMVLADNIDVSYTYSKLRSLAVKNKKIGVDLSILFDRLTCLRTLDLSDCSIKIIPRNINKLMHLRYLNLSHNKKLEELPETVCELYNLQTLDLRNCSGLQKLPNKIGNLVNLRHLMNHKTCISYMPRGIERLSCLQTLTKFVVSDSSSNEKGSFECLANLKQLKGFLSITGLGYVRDGEIKKGELADYKNLYGLSLRFDGWTNDDDEGIFKTFDLPPNIEELVIQCYTGKTMPSDWIDKLGKLRMLKLLSCFEFKDFSELGKLSSLESLIICNMKSVKKVDNVLFGKDTDVTSSSTPNTSIAFPKLKYLKLWNMLAWEELKWSRSSKSKSVKIMPCLRYLVIDSCPKLKSLSPLGEVEKS
ncbi:putative disease resistance protein RGA3 [Mangifera indica]|uniref:putative disease resistance protein RGA3 n=1 Tax=Mangifera indica TaxID=29780 RepID=UPI001CFAD136|nr:putative disease resistance protein RGA3 [Mangifera indica]